MKALEFIRKITEGPEGLQGIIAGGYAVHTLLGTEYDDIDLYIPLQPGEAIGVLGDPNKKGMALKSIKLLDVVFDIQGGHYSLVTNGLVIAAYKSETLEDRQVNLVFIELETLDELFDTFDLSVVRCGMTSASNFTKVELYGDLALESILHRKVWVRKNRGSDQVALDRIRKYQKRLPGFEFVLESGF